MLGVTSVVLAEIAAVLWVAAGVLGFFVGRSGASPGCGWYVLIFFVTGALGCVTFLLGSILGRNLRRDEMRTQRQQAPPPAGRSWSHASSGPPPSATAGYPSATAGYPGAIPPGWHPDRSDPSRQVYWDGTRWTQEVRWNGTEWVPRS